MKSVANKKYWGQHWQATEFCIAPANHPIRQWLESEITQNSNLNVFEVGYYPGKFLAVFGQKGYTLNGIDLYPDKNDLVQKWLDADGYKTGQFFHSDFTEFTSRQQYDVVCSFGFIEHFINWEEVLKKHIQLTKKGGRIMLDVPNLNSPLYKLLYKTLEPEVLDNHVLSVMNVENISRVFKDNGCSVKTAGYQGYFYFRFVTHHSGLSKAISKFINLLKPLMELLPERMYKRYIVVSAIKN